MKILKTWALTAVMAAVVYGVPVNYKISNTGTSKAGCIGTVRLTAGCTLDAVGRIGDRNYSLTSVPSGSTATKAIGIQGGWAAPNTTSRWISPNNAGLTDPTGYYTYTQTFNLQADRDDFVLAGRWVSDNDATVSLNGQVFGTNTSNRMVSWVPFTVGSGFQAGLNTLTYRVRNRPTIGGALTASGLRVEFSTVNLPEAHETTALSLMLGGVMLWSLKRRKAHPEA